MPSSTMLDAALSYLARGWAVLPAHTAELGICSCRNIECEMAGKHPWVNWALYQERLPTEAQVRNWWGQWPDANIAIITGPVSNLVVIDVDPRHGGDESIVKWTPDLPDTAEVQSGGGGVHLYYSHPGEEVRKVGGMMPGVDMQGDKGIIIAPPSVHSSGRSYEWDSGAHIDDSRFAELPLLPHFVAEASRGVAGQGGGTLGHSVSLDALMEGNVRIDEGDRNNTMTRLYGRLFHEADDAEAEAAMLNEQSFVPPLEDSELRKIMDSINRIEQRKSALSNEIVATLQQGEPTEDNRMGMVNALWQQVGLPVASDWFLLRGDVLEYLLITPDAEVRLGANLLDYRIVRIAVFNQAGSLLRNMKNPAWEKSAKPLRQLAREHVVEETGAKERVDLWFAAWFALYPPREVAEDIAYTSLESGPIMLDGTMWLLDSVLARFLRNQLGEELRVPDIKRYLQRAGLSIETLAIGGKSRRAWRRVELEVHE